MAISPKVARDRFVEFAKVPKSTVTTMERKGVVPPRARDLNVQLQTMCDFLRALLDAKLFPWVAAGRAPTVDERSKALLVFGERLAT